MYDEAQTAMQLGEFITKNNPYPLDSETPYPMVLQAKVEPRGGSRAEQREMVTNLRDLLKNLQNPYYDIGGVFQFEYTSKGEPPDQKGKTKIHRLWIVYGSGGNGG